MTETVDIQELKRLAEAAPKSAMDMALFQAKASPDTILALIEENERLTKFIRKTFYVSKADGGIRYSWECDLDLCEVFVGDALAPVRTALEGVKPKQARQATRPSKEEINSIEWKDGEKSRMIGNTLVYRSYEDYCDG